MHDEFFALLHKDHVAVQGLLNHLSVAPASDREELFRKLKMELLPHLEAEEAGFYPALERQDAAREHAWEALEEHRVTEMYFGELEKTARHEERWKAKCAVLADLVNHHIQEEESQVFEDTRKVLSEDQVRDAFHKFSDRKQELQQRLR